MHNLACRSVVIQADHHTGRLTSLLHRPRSLVVLPLQLSFSSCVGLQPLVLRDMPCNAGEDAIKHLLSRGTHREFGYAALVTMLVVYFLGAVWAAGSAIASGLFVPMLLIGSCIGRIVGLICVDMAASGGHGSPRLALTPPIHFQDVSEAMAAVSSRDLQSPLDSSRTFRSRKLEDAFLALTKDSHVWCRIEAPRCQLVW